ncbi:HNH endonuclease [Amycolatopsis tucumanensis]|uniref:HNH nuclease domain-containing protein n=1 Tax=Amycolatopsis tucumanensis TaxID=401106 RepID=A0ABP7I661_9PSEU|nr:HNH endonuclease signature motif containing protein [Amycolatopsis tucumanensis]MCF6425892.1 HNH endonuclease [Amycolatopsis tucumanensis]
MDERPLPPPDSPELAILPTESHRLLYGYLYLRRDDPPTMREIRAYMTEELGEAPAQTDRRVRDLRDHFDVPAVRSGTEHRYELVGWSKVKKDGSRRGFSNRVRAEVLAPQRCAQCGRRPLEHGVVLVVDHKVPREWGGTDDIDNLQPLCEECNAGKKAFYATYDEYAEEIAAASMHPEPHGRIGELLKAFRGDWAPSSLIGVVASMQQYQEDWQKRLRELRLLGWTISSKRAKDPITGRVNTWYRAEHWEPWPPGSIRAEVARRDPSNKRNKT